jgi:hypothetical protein
MKVLFLARRHERELRERIYNVGSQSSLWPAKSEYSDCMRFAIRIIRRRSTFWRNAGLCLRTS